jgi:hypothetical protein
MIYLAISVEITASTNLCFIQQRTEKYLYLVVSVEVTTSLRFCFILQQSEKHSQVRIPILI